MAAGISEIETLIRSFGDYIPKRSQLDDAIDLVKIHSSTSDGQRAELILRLMIAVNNDPYTDQVPGRVNDVWKPLIVTLKTLSYHRIELSIDLVNPLSKALVLRLRKIITQGIASDNHSLFLGSYIFFSQRIAALLSFFYRSHSIEAVEAAVESLVHLRGIVELQEFPAGDFVLKCETAFCKTFRTAISAVLVSGNNCQDGPNSQSDEASFTPSIFLEMCERILQQMSSCGDISTICSILLGFVNFSRAGLMALVHSTAAGFDLDHARVLVSNVSDYLEIHSKSLSLLCFLNSPNVPDNMIRYIFKRIAIALGDFISVSHVNIVNRVQANCVWSCLSSRASVARMHQNTLCALALRLPVSQSVMLSTLLHVFMSSTQTNHHSKPAALMTIRKVLLVASPRAVADCLVAVGNIMNDSTAQAAHLFVEDTARQRDIEALIECIPWRHIASLSQRVNGPRGEVYGTIDAENRNPMNKRARLSSVEEKGGSVEEEGQQQYEKMEKTDDERSLLRRVLGNLVDRINCGSPTSSANSVAFLSILYGGITASSAVAQAQDLSLLLPSFQSCLMNKATLSDMKKTLEIFNRYFTARCRLNGGTREGEGAAMKASPRNHQLSLNVVFMISKLLCGISRTMHVIASTSSAAQCDLNDSILLLDLATHAAVFAEVLHLLSKQLQRQKLSASSETIGATHAILHSVTTYRWSQCIHYLCVTVCELLLASGSAKYASSAPSSLVYEEYEKTCKRAISSLASGAKAISASVISAGTVHIALGGGIPAVCALDCLMWNYILRTIVAFADRLPPELRRRVQTLVPHEVLPMVKATVQNSKNPYKHEDCNSITSYVIGLSM